MIDRRAFLAAAGLSSGTWNARLRAAQRPSGKLASLRTKAIAFDAFAIVDATPVATRAEALFEGKGMALMNAWRTRQFEYTWLRTLGGSYVDFWHVTQEALSFAAHSLNLPMDEGALDSLMQTYRELKAWDDARPALEALRDAGIRMAFLSNFTAAMLDAPIANSGLQDFFEAHLTTDRVHAFKPDRRAYEMGTHAFRARPEEMVFCAAAGWDAAGAKWFGYRTFWLNRGGQPEEALGVRADAVGARMADLLKFVLAS